MKAKFFVPFGFMFSLMIVLGVPTSSPADLGCGSKIGPNQVAFLNKNLECPDDDPALTLEGPNAMLDLGGHTLDCLGAFSVGIQVNGTGANLQHGTVNDCQTGIVVGQEGVFEGGNHSIRKMRVTNSGTGFKVFSNDNKLELNRIIGNVLDGGIIIGNRNTLKRNLSKDNPTGFNVDGIENTLSKNLAILNSLHGYKVLGVRNVVIQNLAKNSGILAGNDGFVIGGEDTQVIWNRGIGNTGSGLRLSVGSGYVLVGNVAKQNQQNGIVLQKGALNSAIFGNVAVGNGDTGLVDENDDCDNNKWKGNFGTRNQKCIR